VRKKKIAKKLNKKSLSNIGGIELITEVEIEKARRELRKIFVFPTGKIIRLDNNRYFLLLEKGESKHE